MRQVTAEEEAGPTGPCRCNFTQRCAQVRGRPHPGRSPLLVLTSRTSSLPPGRPAPAARQRQLSARSARQVLCAHADLAVGRARRARNVLPRPVPDRRKRYIPLLPPPAAPPPPPPPVVNRPFTRHSALRPPSPTTAHHRPPRRTATSERRAAAATLSGGAHVGGRDGRRAARGRFLNSRRRGLPARGSPARTLEVRETVPACGLLVCCESGVGRVLEESGGPGP